MASQGSLQQRFDGEDRYFVTAQLLATDPEKYYELVPGVVGRKLIPKIAVANPYLPVYRWIATKLRGRVKTTRGRVKDAPMASVVREEQTVSIHTFEEAFGWTIDEVRAAREVNGADLDRDSYIAALTKIEQQIDGSLATGIAGTNAVGIANTSGVNTTNGTISGGWLGGSSTPAGIIADVRSAIEDLTSQLQQAQIPGTDMPMFTQFAMWLPLKHWSMIGMNPFGLGTDVQVTTVLKFMSLFPQLKAIEPWWRLDTADSGSPMAVLVACLDDGRMNPMVGGGLLPLDFERLPEQYTGRNVTVPCAGKSGGVAIRYPVAMRYLKMI